MYAKDSPVSPYNCKHNLDTSYCAYRFVSGTYSCEGKDKDEKHPSKTAYYYIVVTCKMLSVVNTYYHYLTQDNNLKKILTVKKFHLFN